MSIIGHQRRPLHRRIASWFGSGLQHVIPPDTRVVTWARRLKSYEEVPEQFRGFLDELPAEHKQPFPYLVLTPTFKGIGRRPEQEKLIGLVAGSLHVVESREGRLSATCFPLGGRCRIERGVLLLSSWITLHAADANGAVHSVTFRYNSITDHLMEPFLIALRALPSGPASADSASGRDRFDYLAQTNYKFYSHGRGTIRPGDRLAQVLLQPEIRAGQLSILGYSVSKRLSPAHLTVLTEAEYITIRDDESQFWIRGSAPGALWCFLPRHMIASASLLARADGLLTLQVDPSVGPPLSSTFECRVEPDLHALVQQLRNGSPHVAPEA